jgi:proline iminopeptidase
MVELYPAIEPHDRGMLAVGDGHCIAWEVSGAANGKPAVVLHGGPGQGSGPGMRRAFDPTRYRVVLYDQRGCGRSIPHASDPATNMAFNTTEHLISDLEALRAHLGIDRWLVAGGSWGCTLALAYAERHPDRVTQMVLTSVTTSRRVEADWLYRGVARFFPDAWELFRNHVPEAVRDEDVVSSYSRRMEHGDAEVRLAAARAWCAWEDAVLSLEGNVRETSYADLAAPDLLAFVRICTHYLRHAAWLEEGALVGNAHRLAGIPGVIIHGRRDMACPFETAWELARAWPGAELVALSDAGHLRTESRRLALLRALDTCASG